MSGGDGWISTTHITQHSPIQGDRCQSWYQISTLIKLVKIRIATPKRMRNIVSIEKSHRSTAVISSPGSIFTKTSAKLADSYQGNLRPLRHLLVQNLVQNLFQNLGQNLIQNVLSESDSDRPSESPSARSVFRASPRFRRRILMYSYTYLSTTSFGGLWDSISTAEMKH